MTESKTLSPADELAAATFFSELGMTPDDQEVPNISSRNMHMGSSGQEIKAAGIPGTDRPTTIMELPTEG